MLRRILVKIPNITLQENLSCRGVSSLHGTDARMERYDEAIGHYWGTAVAQWLRCCATNREVAGSIPASVIGIFH